MRMNILNSLNNNNNNKSIKQTNNKYKPILDGKALIL